MRPAGIALRPLLLAGLVAGTVNLVLGLSAAALWAGAALSRAFAALGFEPQASVSMFVSHTTERLAFGVAVAWLYAAMRPRFITPTRTWLAASLTAWITVIVFFAWVSLAWGLFPGGLMLATVIWGLGEMALTTAAAAWIYERMGGS